MGEKYGTRAAATTGALVRNKLKFLIPASMLLVLVVWNSSSLSPFDAASSGPVGDTVLHHKVLSSNSIFRSNLLSAVFRE